MVEKSLKEINLPALTRRSYYPSPAAWEDQVLYFLMLDRFSDGREQGYLDNRNLPVLSGSTPLYTSGDAGNAVQSAADAARWREAGGRWVGGTLNGLTSKIGYLQRLGVTAIWISPIFRQVPYQDTYHGYGIQNFLDVDPHFGTRQDLVKLVRTAHKHGIYVILDIILNHTGNVFSYSPDRYLVNDPAGSASFFDPRWDGNPYQVAGFHDSTGGPSLPFSAENFQQPGVWPGGAVWPAEFQAPDTFTTRGRINNWDYEPEFLEGDFFDLKDIYQGSGDLDHYSPSPALLALFEVYKYWIALTDIDGFRIDTVKHMDPGATRFFSSVIHEFTEKIGKENFYLIGEITGGRDRAFTTLETTGLDAALGIDDIPQRLEYLVKGYSDPEEYFSLFRNSMLVEKDSHVWFRNKVVTLFDDHDQVRKGNLKGRFCAGDASYRKLLLPVLALNTTTLGIPCIYYGTEQGFDGGGDNDRYIREAMFGGEFGAFRSRGCHFFDESGDTYRELSKVLALRKQKIALRRGRQYLQTISGDGQNFGLPSRFGGRLRSVVPWSRSFDDQILLLAINTDPDQPLTVWVDVDARANPAGKVLHCLYATGGIEAAPPLAVQAFGDRRVVQLMVPAAGFVIYE
jgi:glycosidase